MACLAAAFALAVVVLAAVAALTDFTAREFELEWGRWEKLSAFLAEHPPFQLDTGFWLCVTPVALVMFPGVLWYVRSRLCQVDPARCLAVMVLSVSVGGAAFLLGSMMTETRFSRGEVDTGDVVFAAMPASFLAP
jgi:hypothetical protein